MKLRETFKRLAIEKLGTRHALAVKMGKADTNLDTALKNERMSIGNVIKMCKILDVKVGVMDGEKFIKF
jgi:hypothetical protein